LASDTAIAACNAIVDLFDAGSGAGKLVIYTGTEPAYADTTITDQEEVATCTMGDPAYAAAAADGTNHWADAELAATATDASATGNASAVTFFRGVDSDDNVVLQGTIGTSEADLNLNYTTIGASSTVDITSLEVRVPYNQS
jgi:hypothetical protein